MGFIYFSNWFNLKERKDRIVNTFKYTDIRDFVKKKVNKNLVLRKIAIPALFCAYYPINSCP